MDSKIENIIKVNINDSGSFITPEGVNTIALVVVNDTISTAKSYTSQDEIKKILARKAMPIRFQALSLYKVTDLQILLLYRLQMKRH